MEENLSYNHDRNDPIEHKSIPISQIAEYINNQKGYEIDEVNYSIEKLLEVKFIWYVCISTQERPVEEYLTGLLIFSILSINTAVFRLKNLHNPIIILSFCL